MQAQKVIPVAGHEAMKDLTTGAILFSQTSTSASAVQARRNLKRKIESEKIASEDLKARLERVEKNLELAMNLIRGTA